MPKLVVLLRVKDGMLFAEEWLRCFEKLADEIVALDNGSTDGTVDILEAHPKVVELIHTQGFDEGRDKNLLYNRARLRRPDWLLWVDIDEVFEPGLTRRHFDRLMASRFVNKYAFRRFHFIDRNRFAGSWFRLNYTAGHDRLLWRESPAGYFENLVIDSPNVKGIAGLKWPTNFRLKHLGYINRDLVDKKKNLYLGLLAEEKKAALDEMYLNGERPLRWIDNRNHPQVVLLNGLLNALLLRQWFFKTVHKAKTILAAKGRRPWLQKQAVQ